MNEQLIKALKLALSKKGLSEELYEFINVKEEGEIDGALAKMLGLLPKPPTPANVLEMLETPDFKKEVDRRITKAIDTYKLKNNPNPQPDPNNPDPNDPKLDPNVKALMDVVNGLKTELETMKTGKTEEDKKAEAAKLLAASTVLPEKFKAKWVERVNVKSEVALADQIKALEEEYTDFEQDLANSGQYTPKPGSGNPTTEATVEEAAAVMGPIL